MAKGMNQQKLAVDSGAWPLYRFNPTLAEAGQNPLSLDSKAPKIPLRDYVYNETRYSMLVQSDEGRAEMLLKLAQEDVEKRWKQYEALASVCRQVGRISDHAKPGNRRSLPGLVS